MREGSKEHKGKSSETFHVGRYSERVCGIAGASKRQWFDRKGSKN